MLSHAHPFALKVFRRFVEKNAGDPGLYPAIGPLERAAVGALGEMLGLPEAAGNVLTRGNEANIVALWVARSRAEVSGNQVVLAETAHASYDKAANLLGLELVKVGVEPSGRVRMEEVRSAVGPETIALVGMAGSTDLGAVDPIQELSGIAIERGLHLHVDAAFGGYVLPFLEDLGFPVAGFDFRVPGVSSITIDPHKMGLAPKPAGGVLFRDAEMPAAVSVELPYLAGGKTAQSTLVGTRTGGSVLAVWAMLKHLGRSGYRDVVAGCMAMTRHLLEELATVDGLDVVTTPEMNIVGIRPRRMSVADLARRMRALRWSISQFSGHLRLVVMPHIRERAIGELIADLKDCMA